MDIVTRTEAKERGLARYFTGKPCPHGHVAERWAITSRCVECDRKRHRKYDEANREKIREASRKFREANPEKTGERKRKYYEANREKMREAGRKYDEANREKILERKRKYYEANPEKTFNATALSHCRWTSVLRCRHRRHMPVRRGCRLSPRLSMSAGASATGS